MSRGEREIKERLRVARENRDTGWKKILDDPLCREALWELFTQCRAGRGLGRGPDGAVSAPQTFCNIGKQEIGDWIENRCMLADHRQWLLLLAEHDRPLDDGRAGDPNLTFAASAYLGASMVHEDKTTDGMVLLDEALVAVVGGEVDDFIVSDHLISLMLAQLSENAELKDVFADIFDPEGAEVYLKPISDYVAIGQPVNFYTVVEAAKRRGETAIGYRLMSESHDAEKAYGVHTNPKKSERVLFKPEDKLIVISEG